MAVIQMFDHHSLKDSNTLSPTQLLSPLCLVCLLKTIAIPSWPSPSCSSITPTHTHTYTHPLTLTHTHSHRHTTSWALWSRSTGMLSVSMTLSLEIRPHHAGPPLPPTSFHSKVCPLRAATFFFFSLSEPDDCDRLAKWRAHTYTLCGYTFEAQTEGRLLCPVRDRHCQAPAIKPSQDEARVLLWAGQDLLPLCQDTVRQAAHKPPAWTTSTRQR